MDRKQLIEGAKARARELGWQDFTVTDGGCEVIMLLRASGATEQIIGGPLSKLRKAIGDIGGPEDYAPVEEYDVVVEEYGEHQADTEMVWFYFLHAVEVALEYEAAKAMGAWIAFMVHDVEQKDANVKAYLEAHQAEWEAHEASLEEVREHLDEERACETAYKKGEFSYDEPCHTQAGPGGEEIKPHTVGPIFRPTHTVNGGDDVVSLKELARILTGQEDESADGAPHPEQLVEALETEPEVVVVYRLTGTDFVTGPYSTEFNNRDKAIAAARRARSRCPTKNYENTISLQRV